MGRLAIGAVGPVGVAEMGQGHVADAELVELAQHFKTVVYPLAALDPQK